MIPTCSRCGDSTGRCQMAAAIMTRTKMLTELARGVARAAYIDTCRCVRARVTRFHGRNAVSAAPAARAARAARSH